MRSHDKKCDKCFWCKTRRSFFMRLFYPKHRKCTHPTYADNDILIFTKLDNVGCTMWEKTSEE